MSAPDKLFQLIQSLTKSEKRYFKLFSQLLQGEKEYLKLFDALENSSHYDEKSLFEKLKGSRMLRQFSVAKNYLYNQVLRTLQIFSTREELPLKNQIIQATLLMDKGLYSHAEKIARRAKTEAERRERFPELIESLGIIREAMRRMNKVKEFEVFIREIQAEEKRALQKQNNLLELQHMYDDLMLYIEQNAKARNIADPGFFNGFELNEQVSDSSNAWSVRARCLQLQIQRSTERYLGNFDQSLLYTTELISLMETHTWLLEEQRKKYISEVANAAVLCVQLERYETASRFSEKLNESEHVSPEDEARMFDRFSSLSVSIPLALGDTEAGLKAIARVEDGLKKFGNNLSKANEMNLYYLIASFYLSAAMPEKALPWLLRILNDKGNEMRNDLQCFARIMHLACLLGTGKPESVEYYLQSYARFIFKKGSMLGVEKLALSFFRSASRLSEPAGLPAKAEEYRARLQELLSIPMEKASLNMFNLDLYFRSLSEGCSMIEIKREMQRIPEKSRD